MAGVFFVAPSNLVFVCNLLKVLAELSFLNTLKPFFSVVPFLLKLKSIFILIEGYPKVYVYGNLDILV